MGAGLTDDVDGKACLKNRRKCGALLAATLLAGCAEPFSRIDPSLEQRVRSQLGEVRPMSLGAVAQRPPQPPPASAPASTKRVVAPPAERIELGVDDFRQRILNNNLDLQVVQVDPAIARTRISEAEAKFDATIYGYAQRENEDLPPIDDESLDTNPDQLNRRFAYEGGIEVPMLTGGKAKIGLGAKKKSLDDQEKDTEYQAALKLSLSQPLLRDAGIDPNVASIRLARYGAAVVETRTLLSAIRVLANGEKAYWRAWAAWQELEIRREQYDLAFQNLEFVRKRIQEGASAGIEEVRADLGVVERLERVIVAETQLRLAIRDLKRILNDEDIELNSPTLIVTSTKPTLLNYEFELDALTQRAIDNRLELLDVELQLAADAIQIDFDRNQTLPLFVLDYDYTFQDRGTGWRDALEEVGDGDPGGFSVMLRGEIPVTNELRKSRLRRSLLQRVQRLATREQRTLAIRQEVADSVDVLRQNWQRVLAARQNVVVAKVNYDAEVTQFNEGLRTQTEVLEGLTRLGDAQSREVRAVADYQVAQIDLAFATGTLLGYSKVGIEPEAITPRANPTLQEQIDRANDVN